MYYIYDYIFSCVYIYLTLPGRACSAQHEMFLHSYLYPITVFSSSEVNPLSSLSCAVYVFYGCQVFVVYVEVPTETLR